MSSTGFAPLAGTTVELPSLLLGEKLTLLLAVAAAVAVEASHALHPDAPVGLGIVAGAILLAWQRYSIRRRPRALRIGAAGAAEPDDGDSIIRLADSQWMTLSVGRETRRLGLSLVVHWQAPGRSGMLWLTPCDVPRRELRRWTVRSTATAGAVRT